MRFKISVVKHKGELLFKCGDVLFNKLMAYDEFCGGKLKVLRKGKVVDETFSIAEFGTHGALTCFMGLSKTAKQFAPSELRPSQFKEKDVLLLLDIKESKEFDFIEYLKEFNVPIVRFIWKEALG